ncbi:lactate utilization protein C [Spongisporangium articulatum]|uniref:Lactate utilization protein C n=1 Tax=Spongisporangium articulatum TaxID=3362603 RepID=A0ABW8AML8_9ACTN
MSARDDVLARVRAAWGPNPRPEITVPTTVSAPPDGTDWAELFAERVADYRADVVRCSEADLPTAVGAALAGAARVVVPDGLPDGLVPDALRLRDTGLTATELDAVDAVVTTATLGIAVTGTIVLDHGPGQGRRALTLVPDRHVCVVRAEQVVPDVPDAIARLGDVAIRPLTWISGPSATSDIELNRVEGVHGPRMLTVILVS